MKNDSSTILLSTIAKAGEFLKKGSDEADSVPIEEVRQLVSDLVNSLHAKVGRDELQTVNPKC